MLIARQCKLMALLDAVGEEAGKLDLQKLLFLYCSNEAQPSYEFVPYRFGAFSFTSYADLRRLIGRGLVVEEERGWKLTEEGRREVAKVASTRKTLQEFALTIAGLRGDALVAETYRRFPYYAIHSEMASRLLAGDMAAQHAVELARPPRQSAGLCTIGYEGRALEGYLNLLIKSGVTLLCDVRRNPLSRKYGFSKKTLSHACETVGIRYEHLPELGIATEERRELHTQEDYDTLFASYEAKSLPWQGQALSRIQQWIDSGNRVALTCYEALPHQCHRHCVAEAMQSRMKDLTLLHL